ncbi:MAG: phosphomethylpyrimidine synthase ThiC [Candidatus Diapherotrites archaeon]
MTQLESAKRNEITEEMKQVAKDEHIDVETLRKDVAAGHTIIVKSKLHNCKPLGIGKNLTTKINSNLGTSNHNSDVEKEIEKLRVSIQYGAHTVMDLSTGGNIKEIRQRILSESSVPIGTVPIYEAIAKESNVANLTGDDFINAVKSNIDDGVDFITVHCGVRKEYIPLLKPRIMGVVSRGGSFLVKWMMHHKQENPMYERFDEIVDLAYEHDVALSLGDGLRPGALADATDSAQIAELKTLGKLAKRAYEKNVQVMIEGPGHVPLNQIKENVELQQKYCNNAPFYVLGPLVTDISPGYDHLTGAIGGALAAYYGTAFLCYLTPMEHLGLPDTQHVIDGVVASRIAAHAADIARGIPKSRDIDDEMSRARSNLDWEKMFSLSMNPEKAREMHQGRNKNKTNVCSMCGDLCSVKINKECRDDY